MAPTQAQIPDDLFYAKDYRSDAVPALRRKEKRVKYKHTNLSKIGEPMNPFDPYRAQNVWTDRNKFKMPPTTSSHMRQPERHQKIRACRKAYSFSETPGHRRKTPTQVWNKGHPNDDLDPELSFYDDQALSGVTYSFDARSGPSQGSDIFSYLVDAAEVKYENQVFENLIKNEYDVVQTDDSEEEFELI